MKRIVINQEQVNLVTAAVMAGIWSIKPEKGGEPLNFYQFSGKMAEYMDGITPEWLNETLKEGERLATR